MRLSQGGYARRGQHKRLSKFARGYNEWWRSDAGMAAIRKRCQSLPHRRQQATPWANCCTTWCLQECTSLLHWMFVSTSPSPPILILASVRVHRHSSVVQHSVGSPWWGQGLPAMHPILRSEDGRGGGEEGRTLWYKCQCAAKAMQHFVDVRFCVRWAGTPSNTMQCQAMLSKARQ